MNETWKDVANRVQRLGDNEFRLAYSRATNKNDANEIVALIEDYRQPYQKGKVANIGTAIFATAEQWERIATESNNAAKCELLKDSVELTQLEKLEQAAKAAQEAADAKSRELQAAWEEFNSIPDKVEAINVRLAQIARDRAALETEKLNEEFRSHYKAALNGAIGAASWLDGIAALLVTADLRKGVLNELATELEAELATLKARQKTLAKKLGQK